MVYIEEVKTRLKEHNSKYYIYDNKHGRIEENNNKKKIEKILIDSLYLDTYTIKHIMFDDNNQIKYVYILN